MNIFYLILLSAGGAFLINLLVTPVLLYIAHKNKWYDSIDHRKIHTGDVPRIGGIGICFSFLAGILLFYLLSPLFSISREISAILSYLPLFAGLIIIHILGLVDDFTTIRARVKLTVQLIAAAVIIFTGHRFNLLYIPFLDRVIDIGYFSYALTLLWIVGITNAINLADGLDGLAGGLSSISALFLGFIFLFSFDYVSAIIAFSLFGGILGFLVFNRPPAKLFMGDSGALMLGFTLASLPLFTSSSSLIPVSFLTTFTLLLIPIFDTIAAILRRVRKKLFIFSPDREHMHHKLLSFGFSTPKILITIYLLTTFICTTVLLWVIYRNILTLSFLSAGWIVILLFFLILDRKSRKQ